MLFTEGVFWRVQYDEPYEYENYTLPQYDRIFKKNGFFVVDYDH